MAVAVPALLFTGHFVLERLLRISCPALDRYLDPFCYLPLLLTVWLIDLHWMFGLRRLSGPFTLVASLFLVILAEIIFPTMEPAFVHDLWDYPVYLLGLGYFWFFINPTSTPGNTPQEPVKH